MSKTVYVRYTCPVVVAVEIPDDPMLDPTTIQKVVVEDDQLDGPRPLIEDELGQDAELDDDERKLVLAAVEGDEPWPGWDFGW